VSTLAYVVTFFMWGAHLLATWISCILFELVLEFPSVLNMTWHASSLWRYTTWAPLLV